MAAYAVESIYSVPASCRPVHGAPVDADMDQAVADRLLEFGAVVNPQDSLVGRPECPVHPVETVQSRPLLLNPSLASSPFDHILSLNGRNDVDPHR